MSRGLAVFCLVVTTVIWGFAFVAQKSAAAMGPLSFVSARYLLGGICVLPLAVWEYRRRQTPPTLPQWFLILLFTIVFFFGTWLQQAGIGSTTATNAGFLTGLYVFFVPFILFVGFRHKPHPVVWFCVPLVLAGLYLLNGGMTHLRTGDALIIACAFCWACHILLLGHLARVTGLPIFVSSTCFVGAGLIASAAAFIWEMPTFSSVSRNWIAIAYSGVFSTALAFSLQALGQRSVPSANAAIILSAESLFACLGAALLLHERLSPLGYIGAALIFLSIVLVEAVPFWAGSVKEKREAAETARGL